MSYGGYGYNGGGTGIPSGYPQQMGYGNVGQEQNFVTNQQQFGNPMIVGYQQPSPEQLQNPQGQVMVYNVQPLDQQGQGAYYPTQANYQQGQQAYYPAQASYQPVQVLNYQVGQEAYYPTQALYQQGQEAYYPAQAPYQQGQVLNYQQEQEDYYPTQANYQQGQEAYYSTQAPYQQEQVLNYQEEQAENQGEQETYQEQAANQEERARIRRDGADDNRGGRRRRGRSPAPNWHERRQQMQLSTSSPSSPLAIDLDEAGIEYMLSLSVEQWKDLLLNADVHLLFPRLNAMITDLADKLQRKVTWLLQQDRREQDERRVAPQFVTSLSVHEVLRLPDIREQITQFAKLIAAHLMVCRGYNSKNSDISAQAIVVAETYRKVISEVAARNFDALPPEGDSLRIACCAIRRVGPKAYGSGGQNPDENPLIDCYVQAIEIRALSSRDTQLVRRWFQYDVPRFAARISPLSVSKSFPGLMNRIEYRLKDRLKVATLKNLQKNLNSLADSCDTMLDVLFDYIYGLGSSRNDVNSTIYTDLTLALVYINDPNGIYRLARQHTGVEWNLQAALRALNSGGGTRLVSEHRQPPESVLPEILHSVSLDENGNLYARKKYFRNSVVFREPVVAFVGPTGNYCAQCYAVVGVDFVPCNECTNGVFCCDSCARISRMPMVGHHRDDMACVANVRCEQLTRHSVAITQLVNAVGGPQAMKRMVFKRMETNDDSPYTIRDWKHVTEDYNIFTIAAIFSSCPKSGIASEHNESEKMHYHDFRKQDLKVHHLSEAIILAKSLFDDTSPRMIECLYNMLSFLRRHPLMHHRVSAWHEPIRSEMAPRSSNPSINDAYAFGAFGAGFIRYFSCQPNIGCRLVIDTGIIEYVALRKIEQGEALQLEWPTTYATGNCRPGTPELEKFLRRHFGRMCWCARCKRGRQNHADLGVNLSSDNWNAAASSIPEPLKLTMSRQEYKKEFNDDSWRNNVSYYGAVMQSAARNPLCETGRQTQGSRQQQQRRRFQQQQQQQQQQEEPANNQQIRNEFTSNLQAENDRQHKFRQCLAQVLLQTTQQKQQSQQQ